MSKRPSKSEADIASQFFREKLTPRRLNTLFRQLMEKAKVGSMDAIKILLERAYGKPTESVEVTTKSDFSAMPMEQLYGMIEQAMLERGRKMVAIDAKYEVVPQPALPETKLAGLTQELEHALATGTIGPDAVPAPQVLHDPVRPDAEPSPDHAPDRTGESDGAARGGAGDGGAVPASSVRGIAQDAGPEQSAGVAGPEDEDPSTLLDDCEEEIAPEGTAGVQRGSTGSLDMGGGDPSEPAV